MKLFRGVLLPIFLCASILAIGFFAPQLFLRRIPDFKNDPQTVSIAGTENPMYVAADTELILPPWERYDADSALPAQSYMDSEQLERFALYLQECIPLLLPEDAALPEDPDAFMPLVKTNDGNLFFLEAYRLSGKDGDYLLSFVTLYDMLIYFDVIPADGGTQAMHYPKILETNFYIAANLWKSAYPRTDTAATLAKANYENSSVTECIRFWALLDSLLSRSDFFGKYPEAFKPWNAVLESYQDVYTFNYENRSYITLTNVDNFAATMIYDRKAGSFVGFSLDPAFIGFYA